MKTRYLLGLLLIAAMVFPTMVGAAGDTLPGAGWWTGQQIQNIGSATAAVVSTAYDAGGPATYTASANVAAGASVTFLPDAFAGMPQGFQGSAIVSADQPIKAIVSVTNRYVPPYGVVGGVAGSQYQGTDGTAADTSVFFPIVKNAFGGSPNIKTTTFFVQNAGAVAADVTITYLCPASYSQTVLGVDPGDMVVLNPSAAGVPAGSLCAGTATSTEPLAGVAAEHYNTEPIATLVQSTRGFTSADYDTEIFAPIFKKAFPAHATQSRTTGGQVMNVSGGALEVTANYVGVGGTCVGVTATETSGTLQNGESHTFLNPADLPAGCLASASFSASGNIVGIVNESYLNPAPTPGTQSSTSYNMAAGTSATAQAVAPLFKEVFGGKTSGLQVQNVGTVDATIHVVFRQGATSWTTINVTVAPGASQNYYLVNDDPIWVGPPMPMGTVASATVISDQPVLAAVAEQPYTLAVTNCFGQASGPCYDRQNYEGFNVPAVQ
jgi:hypothetical protein